MSKQKWGLKQGGRVSLAGVLALFLALGGVTLAQSEVQVMEMAAAIQKAIVTLPNYGVFDQLSFGIEQETVILRGFASRPTLKNSAEKVHQMVNFWEAYAKEVGVVLPETGVWPSQ